MMSLFAMLLMLLSGVQAAPAVPDNLKPPANEKLILQVRAEGEQVYNCDGEKWVLLGPDAKLFDISGKQVGRHSYGPVWEWSDGSRVTGKAVASATPSDTSIPWLLLSAVAHEGNGVLKNVTSIQRLFTRDGKAPATGCDAKNKGVNTRSHYTATYYFYTSAQ